MHDFLGACVRYNMPSDHSRSLYRGDKMKRITQKDTAFTHSWPSLPPLKAMVHPQVSGIASQLIRQKTEAPERGLGCVLFCHNILISQRGMKPHEI